VGREPNGQGGDGDRDVGGSKKILKTRPEGLVNPEKLGLVLFLLNLEPRLAWRQVSGKGSGAIRLWYFHHVFTTLHMQI
jgi:hypothetical protein